MHHLITEDDLKAEMEKYNYHFLKQICTPLPNGKKLRQLDFVHKSNEIPLLAFNYFTLHSLQ